MCRLVIFVIAHKFAWTIKDVRDGLTHRYYGLYASLCKYVLKHGGCVYWYDVSNKNLLGISDLQVSISKSSMFKALLLVARESIKRKTYVIVILDYPHSFLGIKYLVDYLLSLLVLHILRLTRRYFVVVDNMDPPIEHAIELNGRIRTSQHILWSLLNLIVFKYDLIVFHSQSYRIYHSLYYKIDLNRSCVISPGSFPDVIPFTSLPPPPLRILIVGNVNKWIGLERLLKVLDKLHNMYTKVKFIVIDRTAPKVKSDKIDIINTYLDYMDYVKTLTQAHILLLLRPKSLHHLLTVRATLADYMMAGRPILYLYSLGMKEILEKAKCGYAFKSLEDIPHIVAYLNNEKFLYTLARNARRFAVKYLCYRKHALRLLMLILKHIKSKFEST